MRKEDAQVALLCSRRSTALRKAAGSLAKRALDDLSLISCLDKSLCLAAVSTTRGWGFINKSGNFAIEPKYAWAASYSNGRACFSFSDSAYRWACISYSWLNCLRDVDSFRFEFLYGQTPGVQHSEEIFGYIDQNGKEVVSPRFCCAEPFRQDVARVAVSENEGVGFIRADGSYEIEPQFDEATNFDNNLAIVSTNDKYGVLNRLNGLVVKPQFDYIWNFSEGLARFRVGDKIGFLDTSGKVTIEPIFDCAWEFAEGLSPVQIDGDWGFISKDGKFAIAPQFCSASCFTSGVAEVEEWEAGGPCYIDRTGAKNIHPPIERSSNSVRLHEREKTCRAGLWGFEDQGGRLVIPATYQSVGDFSNGLARVANQEGLWGFINQDGQVVIPMQYSDSRDFCTVNQESAQG